MTTDQQQKIETLRASGMSYAQIARSLNIPVSTIKSYFARRSSFHYCKQCGIPIVQKSAIHPRLFCSDKCRALWRYHNIVKHDRAKYPMTCPACGTKFKAVSKTQKYCSHACYVHARFGKKCDPHE